MTDHIPLDKARPGDMVFLKPIRLINPANGYWLCANTHEVRQSYSADQIDHIERSTRVLKVGEPAIHKISGARVTVRFIEDGWAAWVAETSGAAHGWSRLTALEPVE